MQAKNREDSIDGGPPQALANAGCCGGTWALADDGGPGTIVFPAETEDGLERISAAGGDPVRVTALDPSRHETSHRHPQFLPDGRHFPFLAISDQEDNNAVFVGDVRAKPDPRNVRKVMRAASHVWWAPPGYLLFLRDNNLMAQAFDARRFEVSGEPLVVAEHVGNGFNRHTSDFSVSATGLLAWRSGFNADRELAWFDRSGKQITGLDAREPYLSPRLSPDGGRVALIRLGTRVLGSSEGRIESSLTGNIGLMDLGSGALSAFADGSAVEPVWSPDGRRIVFGRYEKGVCGLYWKPVSEIGDEELLLRSAHESAPLGFSPDGWFLLFHESDRGQVSDLFLLPLMGDRKPILISHNTVSSAAFSPDGRWIAYAAAGLGRFEVFVRSFAGGDTRATSGKWQVSTSGGWLPRWRHDGGELFYYSFYNTLVGVPVTAGVTFRCGAPVTLFDPHDYNQTDFAYDVSADGQRFLISRIFEDEDRPINIALDWLSLAKK